MTETFRFGHAAGSEWTTLTDRCLEQIGEPPPGANIGFVYVTDMIDEEFPQIFNRLRSRTGVEHWFGTVGMGVMVGGQEYFGEPAMAAMVGSLPEDSFRILPTVERPGDVLPQAVSEWSAETRPKLGIVHADPRNAYVADILHSVSDDTDAVLVGGLSASRGRQTQIAGNLTEGGISGVLLSGKVLESHGLSQGCKPIGKIHEVTEARDNVLIHLDGRPALRVFREDIGIAPSDNLPPDLGSFHAAFPIAGGEGRDYLVRNLTGIGVKDEIMAIGARVSPGDRLMFVRRDRVSALEDLERMLEDVTARSERPPRSALYFSCVARGPNLFGPGSQELTTVQNALGDDVPVIGFFANGEICDNRLYGYTGVLTVLY